MPPQQGIWLNDHEGLLPRLNQPGQQDQEDAIGVRACGPFHLSLEDDELLPQEGIFGDQLCLASAKIGEGGQRQGGQERFGPTSKARGERIQAAILQPLEMSQNTSHTRSFSIT
jgi:hypothetical protein